jgi:hypothetical protein
MGVLFTIIALVLLVAGGTGLVLTCSNHLIATLDWIEGILTYGVFVILGLSAIVMLTLTPRER